MPERDATLDAFVSSSTDGDAETEDGRDADCDGNEQTVGDQPDAENDAEPEGETVPADETETKSSESKTDSKPPDSEIDPGASEPERVSEPAVTTMAWSPDGAACESCGSTAMRRWRTDSGFRCPSCVDWERTPNQ